jgi:hypothetical protein
VAALKRFGMADVRLTHIRRAGTGTVALCSLPSPESSFSLLHVQLIAAGQIVMPERSLTLCPDCVRLLPEQPDATPT